MTSYPTSRAGTSDIWEAMHTQRAIRYWEEREVPQEVIWKVIEAATRAPSGSNLQPWRFIVVTDTAKRARLASALAERMLAGGGAERMERARTLEDRTERLMMTGATTLFERIGRAPLLVVPCLYGVTSPTTDVDTLLAGSSIYGAVQNLQLAARALGLGTVLTTVHARIDDVLRQELKVPESARPVAFIPWGYPAANFGPTKRRPVEEVTYWDTWESTRSRE